MCARSESLSVYFKACTDPREHVYLLVLLFCFLTTDNHCLDEDVTTNNCSVNDAKKKNCLADETPMADYSEEKRTKQIIPTATNIKLLGLILFK